MSFFADVEETRSSFSNSVHHISHKILKSQLETVLDLRLTTQCRQKEASFLQNLLCVCLCTVFVSVEEEIPGLVVIILSVS